MTNMNSNKRNFTIINVKELKRNFKADMLKAVACYDEPRVLYKEIFEHTAESNAEILKNFVMESFPAIADMLSNMEVPKHVALNFKSGSGTWFNATPDWLLCQEFEKKFGVRPFAENEEYRTSSNMAAAIRIAIAMI